MTIVQLILLIALLVCFGIGVYILAKSMRERGGRKTIFQFAAIEFILFFIILVTLSINFKSNSSIGLNIFMSVIYTFLANIPLGLLALCIKAFKKKDLK